MNAFKGFRKDGKPFFAVGAQAHNSSSYTEEDFRHAALCTKNFCCNMIEAPVYWHKIEPEEGVFDFTSIDYMIKICRETDLKLIVLWFASWKNGDMSYCPEYVKADTKRFPRALTADGSLLQNLSSHVSSNMLADARAFVKFMEHVRETDAGEQTIIAIQVQNEPGYLHSDRDYRPESVVNLKKDVPDGLVDFIVSRRSGFAYEQWVKYGSRRGGSWEELFGIHGIEFCEAYHLSQYIDYIAARGKEAYNIPMLVNVWLGTGDFDIPGIGCPGGGAVLKTIDIWKYESPHIDIIAPDIYVMNYRAYRELCDGYARDDNPLFVPESHRTGPNTAYMFYAVGAKDAIGYATFGVESSFEADGVIKPQSVAMRENNKFLLDAHDLLCKYRGTGRIYPVVQETDLQKINFEFERYYGCVKFEFNGYHGQGTGYKGRNARAAEAPLPIRGLIFEAGPTEFYLAGNFHLKLMFKASPARNLSSQPNTVIDFASVQEGYFDESGEFIVTGERNGDEVMFGDFWCAPHCGVTRVRMIDIV
jgi:hypothetical protein